MTKRRFDTYRHARYAWDDDVAARLDPVERLVYRSNLLGADRRITNTGGGNTSSKVHLADPVTGRDVDVLWVKGSGGDLRTASREHFASFELDRLNALRERYERSSGRGPKTSAEDEMVDAYVYAVYGANPRPGSIDTPLHAFVPWRYVDHTHPDAVIAIAAAADGRRLAHEVYGDEVGWVDWQRPGVELGLQIAAACAAQPDLRGVVMGQHGLICWDDDDKGCYETTLELIERAGRFIEARAAGSVAFGGPRVRSLSDGERRRVLVDVLPRLRGMVSSERRFIATVQDDERVRAFVDSVDAPRLSELGTSCPDHFLRTKIKPLYVPWDPDPAGADGLLAAVEEGLHRYRDDYRAYYDAHAPANAPALRDTNPTVMLIPGVGMITFGRNKSESRVTAEFFAGAIEVMRGAESLGDYIALPRQEAFDIEYWRLEEAKLRRMPPEREFERSVVVVIGAGSGIGKATALRMARERAHVVCADLDEAAAVATARELSDIVGHGIGVGGSGVSGCGPAIGVGVDVTNRDSLRALFDQVVLAYGGCDAVVVTAGLYVPSDAEGRVSDADWARTFDVNVKGGYLVADEAQRVWLAQGTTASLVLTTSVNAVVAKAGSMAYDTSKAAAQHLVRELAVALAPLVRVNALAPATVVDGSSMFSRERVIGSLRRYGLPLEEGDDDDTMRQRLAAFYASRTLLQAPITVEQQAEAAYLLTSDRLSRTTGQVLTVDGGLTEAFLR